MISKKSMTYAKYMRFLAIKAEYVGFLLPFYQQKVFRIQRWHRHMETKRSESRLVQKFRTMYGGPERVIVCFGDWS